MSQPSPDDDRVLAVFHELRRIYAGLGVERFATSLPLVNDADALAFLRTVPTSVSLAELERLARAYRAAHPTSALAWDDEDDEDDDP